MSIAVSYTRRGAVASSSFCVCRWLSGLCHI